MITKQSAKIYTAVVLALALFAGLAWLGMSEVNAQNNQDNPEERTCNRIANYEMEGVARKGKHKDKDQKLTLKSCTVGEEKEWEITWIGHSNKKKVAVVDESAHPLPKPGKVSQYWKSQRDGDNVSKSRK